MIILAAYLFGVAVMAFVGGYALGQQSKRNAPADIFYSAILAILWPVTCFVMFGWRHEEHERK